MTDKTPKTEPQPTPWFRKIVTGGSRMKKILAYLFLLVSLPAVGDPVAATNDILVGINYFYGWWEELPNRWHSHGWATNEPDWRKQFPERVPLLGCYNGQKTMDREIVAAATHGVDFFAFLWYFEIGRASCRERV